MIQVAIANYMLYPIFIGLGLIAGFLVGYFIRKKMAQAEADSLESKMHSAINDAKAKEKEILLKAKEEEQNRRSELRSMQSRLEKRETLFDQKLLNLESKQSKLQKNAQKLEAVKKQIQKIRQNQLDKLEKIAGLNKEEAKNLLLENVEKDMGENLMERIKKLDEENSTELEKEAKKRLVNVIQRCSVNHAVETTTTVIDLPSDEMKGRIIGREGRNIRAIEKLTGVEIVVDDTPEAITISGFSPIRRQVAKTALDKLILDGRIHPARIEEAVEEAKKEIALDIKKAGEDACYEVGIAGLDPKL